MSTDPALDPSAAVAAMALGLGGLALAVWHLGHPTPAAGLGLVAAYTFGSAATRGALRRQAHRAGGAYLVRLDLDARRWRVIPETGTRPVAATRVARAIAAELERRHPAGHITITHTDQPYADPPDLRPPGAHRRPHRFTFPSDEDPRR